jgi:hypothetical protein
VQAGVRRFDRRCEGHLDLFRGPAANHGGRHKDHGAKDADDHGRCDPIADGQAHPARDPERICKIAASPRDRVRFQRPARTSQPFDADVVSATWRQCWITEWIRPNPAGSRSQRTLKIFSSASVG